MRQVDADASLQPHSIVVDEETSTAYTLVRNLGYGLWVVIPKYLGSDPYTVLALVEGSTKRLIGSYSTLEVHAALAKVDLFSEDVPQYGIQLKLYKTPGKPAVYCDPLLAAQHLPRLVDVVPELEILVSFLGGKFANCIYVTGSLLMGSLKAYSDVDLVLDVSKPHCYAVVDALNAFVPEGGLSFVRHWLEREAAARGVPLEVIVTHYVKWRRFKIGERVFSLSISDMELRKLPERRVFEVTGRVVERIVSIEPYQRSLGDYPHLAWDTHGTATVVYDGFYVPRLFAGGRFYVRGVAASILVGGEKVDAIAIGPGEAHLPTYLVPIS
jgi:hypothetical protein